MGAVCEIGTNWRVEIRTDRRRWFRRRRGDEQRALTEMDVPWMSAPTVAGVTVTADGALRIVDVLACVRLLAESALSLIHI